jgi:hypothetical protein
VRDDATTELLQVLAGAIADFLLAAVGDDGKVPAFTLLIWPSGEPGDRVNYVSNVPRVDRDQIRKAMASLLERWNAADHRKG